LIEESRTNSFSYSESFSSWQYNSNVIAKDNSVIAPDGTIGASEIVETTVNAQHNVAQSIAVTGQKVFSVFVKKGVGSRNFRITDYNATDGEVSVTYNLSTGDKVSEVGSPNSIITNYSNGWYRISITSTTTTTSIYYIQLMDNNTTTYTGNGYSSIYIWGAQLETGSFPTSYIKTTGTDATRRADDASITGENFSSWYRQDEGSLYSEVNTLASSSGSRISMSDGTSDNRIFISNGIYPLYINKNGDIQVRETSSALVNVYSKRAVGLKKNDFALSIDGGDLLVDASGDLPFVDRLAFSTSHTSDNHVNGHIKKLAYYPQRLTNEQLQNLTK